jgi:protein-L-isoaspartate(D-aspartate) O-methyltransferase
MRESTRLRVHARSPPIAAHEAEASLTSTEGGLPLALIGSMDRRNELAIIRRAYAKQILAEAQVVDSRIEAAFAAVPREDFLGPGPWSIPRWTAGPVLTPNADPIYVYVDNVVQIVAERHLNNGQPSAHAKWMGSAAIREGDHVVHVGAGTGYYTAIMAHLVGPSGRVAAIELDPALAARAEANLSTFDHVRVVEGDGTTAEFDAADVIYVNAGATRPADAWLDGLSEGGRLMVPLTTNEGFLNDSCKPLERRGAMFRIERRTPAFLARWISPAAFIPCDGARDAASEAALAEALGKGGWEKVTHLYRRNSEPMDRCWLDAPGWSLV